MLAEQISVPLSLFRLRHNPEIDRLREVAELVNTSNPEKWEVTETESETGQLRHLSYTGPASKITLSMIHPADTKEADEYGLSIKVANSNIVFLSDKEDCGLVRDLFRIIDRRVRDIPRVVLREALRLVDCTEGGSWTRETGGDEESACTSYQYVGSRMITASCYEELPPGGIEPDAFTVIVADSITGERQLSLEYIPGDPARNDILARKIFHKVSRKRGIREKGPY